MHSGPFAGAHGRARSPQFIALAGGVAMALVGALSLALHAPLMFPALGASTWVVFRHPTAPPAAPRNVILGHALGAGIGWLALWLCVGFEVHGSLAGLSDWHFVASGTLALAATMLVLERLDVIHPPAAATTMIVGMGLLPRWTDLVAIVGAAALLSAVATMVTRATRTRVEAPASAR